MLVFVFDSEQVICQVRDSYPSDEERSIISKAGGDWVSRNDIRSFAHAEQVAAQATAFTGELHIATDAGASVSPRMDVIRAPALGDEVSYAFNGDSYPCGLITGISPTLKKVTTTTGRTFYRRERSAAWISQGTWSMTRGHINKRNPSF